MDASLGSSLRFRCAYKTSEPRTNRKKSIKIYVSIYDLLFVCRKTFCLYGWRLTMLFLSKWMTAWKRSIHFNMNTRFWNKSINRKQMKSNLKHKKYVAWKNKLFNNLMKFELDTSQPEVKTFWLVKSVCCPCYDYSQDTDIGLHRKYKWSCLKQKLLWWSV